MRDRPLASCGAVLPALLAASCMAAPAHIPARAVAATPVPSLASAVGDMYANRYTDAQRSFQRRLAAGEGASTDVATYALFLNYAGEQETALAEAQLATALDPRSGLAFAVLCRVRDWSADFPAAVSAGRSATRLAAQEPLAHLFLAEALADTGDLAGSQAEISTAATLIGAGAPAYLRAELLREQGNLAGDRGDDRGRLASFTAARAVQPGWLYRDEEVIDAFSAAGDAASARQQLQSAAARAPDDPLLLATLGTQAVNDSDAAQAAALWSRAARLASGDARILTAAGTVLVAANHDINAAVADFQVALRAQPGYLPAAAALAAVAGYLQHDPRRGAGQIAQAIQDARRSTAPPDPAAVQAAHAQQALAEVNRLRAASGLGPVRLDPRLSASARSHSWYWVFNNFSSTVGGLGIHEETPGLPNYSGGFPWTRAVAYGYPNQRIGEDIDHRGDPVAAVDEWWNSIFHRFAIMRRDLVAIGYGEAETGPMLMEDMEFGFAPPAGAAPVLTPGSGAQDVPAMFVDNELPDPVPAGRPRTTGAPVSVTFGAADTVRVTAFTVTAPTGAALPAYSGPPSGADENSAWLLPQAPLSPGATYTAHISALVDWVAFDRTWSFTTGA
jgi:uncharacterized protein YkwD